jgi:hypothetical protein
MPISKAELAELKRAKLLLENPGLAARLSSMLGSPLERGMAMLPARFQSTVQKASEAAMMKALDVAVNSISSETSRKSNLTRDRAHKFAAATSGAVGGAFGLFALSVELPISTTIMLRSVADIAKSEGENIQHIETRLACLTVFAMGGRSAGDDAAESGYFAARLAMSGAVSEASKFLAEKGMSKAGFSSPYVTDCVAIRHCGVRKGSRTGDSHYRRSVWRAHQHLVHRTFSEHGARSLYCPAAGKNPRR